MVNFLPLPLSTSSSTPSFCPGSFKAGVEKGEKRADEIYLIKAMMIWNQCYLLEHHLLEGLESELLLSWGAVSRFLKDTLLGFWLQLLGKDKTSYPAATWDLQQPLVFQLASYIGVLSPPQGALLEWSSFYQEPRYACFFSIHIWTLGSMQIRLPYSQQSLVEGELVPTHSSFHCYYCCNFQQILHFRFLLSI